MISSLIPSPPAGWIREGNPVAHAITLSESPDSLLTAGRWTCTAGTFPWIFATDEVVQILEGEVRIREAARRTCSSP